MSRPSSGAAAAPPGARTAPRRDPGRTDHLLHGGGALLLLGGCGWLLLLADATGGDALATCGILALVATAYGASRAVTRRSGWAVPLLIGAGCAVFALLRAPTLLNHPGGAPLGYSNAAGSLFMLAAAAALLAAARSPSRVVRVPLGVLAIAFAAVPWLNESIAPAVLSCALPLALLARGARGARVAVCAAAGAVVATLAVVVFLGATYRPDGGGAAGGAVDSTLTTRRVMLWNDALRLFADHPVAGVGPGRFPLESPTARAHPDTAWPHNETLHFAAEAGLPGAVLLLGLFALAFARLWHGPGDAGAAVAALALGAAGVHANVDYVLHYPAVPVVLAALVGAGSTAARARRAGPPRSPAARPVPGRM